MTEIKNILIVGREGKEKARLANTLLNKNGNFEEVFSERKESDSSSDKHYQIEETIVDGTTYRIIDLIGATNPIAEVDEPRVREELTELVNQLKPGINHFLLLTDQGIESELRSKEKIFRELFVDEDFVGSDYATFVDSSFADFKNQYAQDRQIQELLEDPETSDYLKELIMNDKFLQVNAVNSDDQVESYRLLWQHLGNSKSTNYFSKKMEKLLKTEINLKDLTSDQLWELRNQELKVTASKNSSYQPDSIINGQELAHKKIDFDLQVLVWNEVPAQLEKAKKARNILLIGRTGAGKSSLANLLAGQDLFKTRTGGISVTKDYQTELFNDKKTAVTYRLIDTIGLGDTKLSEEEVLNKLMKITERLENGLHQVIFVVRGRFVKEEVAVFEALKSLFGEEVVNYCTIVRNHFTKFRDGVRCEQDFEDLVDEEGKIRKVLEGIRGEIIYLDNPPLVGSAARQEDLKEAQQVAREKLLNHLTNKRLPYKVNLDQKELDRRIQAHLDPLEKQIQEARKELEQKKEQLNASHVFSKKITDWNNQDWEDWKKKLLNNPVQSQLEQDVYRLHCLLPELIISQMEKKKVTLEEEIDHLQKQIKELQEKDPETNREIIRELEQKLADENKNHQHLVRSIWCSIHESFIHHWQLWENDVFTYQEARKWISAGFKPNELMCIKEWEKAKFSSQQAREWILVGLSSYDYRLASYARWKGYQPTKINLEKLRKEWEEWKKAAPVQEWLDVYYPPEVRTEITSFKNYPDYENRFFLKGSFNSTVFPNLEYLCLENNLQLTDLVLKKGSRINQISLSNNAVKNLVINDQPFLTSLSCGGTDHLTNLTLINNPQLSTVRCNKTSLTKISLDNNPKLSGLFLENNQITGVNSIGCFDLFQVDLINNPLGKNILAFLQNCSRLSFLSLSNVNRLDIGLEYLPANGELILYNGGELLDYLKKNTNTNVVKNGRVYLSELAKWREKNPQLIAQMQVPPKK